MSKYRSREEPVPGSSISETHPGYLADRINWERNIRNRWFREYGHVFYGKQLEPPSLAHAPREPHLDATHDHGEAEKGLEKGHPCVSGPRWPPRKPIPQVTSQIREEQALSDLIDRENRILTAPIGWYNYDDMNVSSECKQPVRIHDGGQAPKMVYDYPTPGNIQKHHVVEDPITVYSTAYGHRSVQFGKQNVHSESAQAPTSINDLHMQIPNSAHDGNVQRPEYPGDIGEHKPCSSSSDPQHPWDILTPDGRADLDKMAQLVHGCSWAEVQRRIRSIPDPEVCPKCRRLACTCIPRRRQAVPEFPSDGPSDELPPWPPQIWCGQTYGGTRQGTLGDILRLRYRLSRDPDNRTPMNRMYDEMKEIAYYGKNAEHVGESSFSCGGCRTAREAERGTWFDEQLRRGNPFTTGDTQFKANAYARRN